MREEDGKHLVGTSLIGLGFVDEVDGVADMVHSRLAGNDQQRSSWNVRMLDLERWRLRERERERKCWRDTLSREKEKLSRPTLPHHIASLHEQPKQSTRALRRLRKAHESERFK